MTVQASIFRTYPGGKGSQGVAQTLISFMPMHSIYVEPFLGGGRLLRSKRPPSGGSVGIDVDAGVIDAWRQTHWPHLTLLQGDGIKWLARDGARLPSDALVYCDPPYLPETRLKPKMYRCEMTREQHVRLLKIIRRLRCLCMISGYRSAMYDAALDGWHVHEIQNHGRAGSFLDYVWCNFAPPAESGAGLHDVRWFGKGFRDRTRIKRKAKRWATKFRRLPAGERQAVLAELAGVLLDSSSRAGTDVGGRRPSVLTA